MRAFFTVSSNNPRILFSTINSILNPHAAADLDDPASSAKCEEFACFFKDGIHNMRLNIQIMPGNFTAPLAVTAPLTQHHD